MILEEMIKLNADGVVFHDIFTSIDDLIIGRCRNFGDYTLEQVKNDNSFPKSGRTYYKIVNGKREYIR